MKRTISALSTYFCMISYFSNARPITGKSGKPLLSLVNTLLFFQPKTFPCRYEYYIRAPLSLQLIVPLITFLGPRRPLSLLLSWSPVTMINLLSSGHKTRRWRVRTGDEISIVLIDSNWCRSSCTMLTRMIYKATERAALVHSIIPTKADDVHADKKKRLRLFC